MQLRAGYKQSDVGVIPEDWDVEQVARLSEKVGSGITPTGGNRVYQAEGRPFVRSQNVGWGQLLLDDIVFIDERTHATFSDTELRSGDVLLNITGASIGRSAVADDRVATGNVNQHVCVIRPNERLAPGFLCAFLISARGQDQIGSFQAGGNRQGLNFAQVRSLCLPLPGSDEQRRIVFALSDVDGLLSRLDQLIGKKRKLKQATMQQLLTGRARLPGFSDEWETKRLADLGVFLKGTGVTKDQALNGSLPCVRYGEIYTHHNDYIRKFNSHITPDVAADATRLRRGDLLFAGSGETKDEIGKCVAFIDDFEAFAGGDIVILRPIGIDPIFMAYCCNLRPVAIQKASRGQGDAVVHISAGALADIRVIIPSYVEQSAIATVLFDMDAEIAALEQRRSKTAGLKQAIMQELLTGRTRLSGTDVVERQPESPTSKAKGHSWAFNEAVVISVLVKAFGSEQFPLGRKRYTKLSYLLHRHVERQAEGYLKKAAGPYNPQTKYAGPEKIAIEGDYIRPHKAGKYDGFVAGEKVALAEAYFDKWYGADVLKWVGQFRFSKNDDLELLTTVDMSVEELCNADLAVDVEAVKTIIRDHPDWRAKLDRSVFSDPNIAGAIERCRSLFAVIQLGGTDA
jgi:type I restriction enzyme S subunit